MKASGFSQLARIDRRDRDIVMHVVGHGHHDAVEGTPSHHLPVVAEDPRDLVLVCHGTGPLGTAAADRRKLCLGWLLTAGRCIRSAYQLVPTTPIALFSPYFLLCSARYRSACPAAVHPGYVTESSPGSRRG